MSDLKLLIKLFSGYKNKLKQSIQKKDDVNILYYKRKYHECLDEINRELKEVEPADVFESVLLNKSSKKDKIIK